MDASNTDYVAGISRCLGADPGAFKCQTSAGHKIGKTLAGMEFNRNGSSLPFLIPKTSSSSFQNGKEVYDISKDNAWARDNRQHTTMLQVETPYPFRDILSQLRDTSTREHTNLGRSAEIHATAIATRMRWLTQHGSWSSAQYSPVTITTGLLILPEWL